jgi:hypothetical protein
MRPVLFASLVKLVIPSTLSEELQGCVHTMSDASDEISG